MIALRANYEITVSRSFRNVLDEIPALLSTGRVCTKFCFLRLRPQGRWMHIEELLSKEHVGNFLFEYICRPKDRLASILDRPDGKS